MHGAEFIGEHCGMLRTSLEGIGPRRTIIFHGIYLCTITTGASSICDHSSPAWNGLLIGLWTE
jgi:hypothetical protein